MGMGSMSSKASSKTKKKNKYNEKLDAEPLPHSIEHTEQEVKSNL